MTTIINTPPSADNATSGLSIVLGVIVALALVVLFFVYGLPALRNAKPAQNDSINVNVTTPTPAPTTPSKP